MKAGGTGVFPVRRSVADAELRAVLDRTQERRVPVADVPMNTDDQPTTPKGPDPMTNTKTLARTLCSAYAQGAAARHRLAALSDSIVSDAGGELTEADIEMARRCGTDLEYVRRAKQELRTRDVVKGLVTLAQTVPGAEARITTLAAQLQTQTATLSARDSSSAGLASAFDRTNTTVPTALTAFDREVCTRSGVAPDVALRAAQNVVRGRLSRC